MGTQFWVIGGEYNCIDFKEVVPGTAQVFGPYMDLRDARDAWRARSMVASASAMTRYSIVGTPGTAEQVAA